jgi:hypothetical protein
VTGRRWGLALASYFVIVALVSAGLRAWVMLHPDPAHPHEIIASVWRGGELVAREVLPSAPAHAETIDETLGAPGSELVLESVVAEGPLLARPDLALALSLVPGHDGVVATLGGATAIVTPDDLLDRRAYDHPATLLGVDLPMGTDTEILFALLAERLATTAPRVREGAVLRRIRIERSTPLRDETPGARVDGPTLSVDLVRDAARDAALYLARNTGPDGRFRYLVDATSDQELPGYDWPRHAGATYFLAQAAEHFHDPDIATACLRAASLMRDHAVLRCGEGACVGEGSQVDLGSSALGLLAFAEIVRTGLDVGYETLAVRLARFVRDQQRPDGEFMHEYDRTAGHPIDVQYVYYSGEATLALARAHKLSRDPRDLYAAATGLAHLVGPAWRFPGDRYYFGEEHWTCQAMADLWDRAPDAAALEFCERWQAYNRKLQYRSGEAIYDVDGAIGVGPFAPPRLTPVASRCEAGIATLEVISRERSSREAPQQTELEHQLKSALALLVRRQMRPGPIALFSDPARVYGAMPGSEVDFALRIDYAQHAGSAMLRWIDLETGAARPAEP